MDEFMKIYIPFSLEYPITLSIRYMHNGIPRWMIDVFGKDMAHCGGGTCDMQILHVEEKEWQHAIENATERLKKRADEIRYQPFGSYSA